jgi:tetrahydromethanopterin S-methyltransferase subunit B
MNSPTSKQLGLPPMPVNANRHKTPPVVGIFALYAFGVVTGLGIAFLAFTFCF